MEQCCALSRSAQGEIFDRHFMMIRGKRWAESDCMVNISCQFLEKGLYVSERRCYLIARTKGSDLAVAYVHSPSRPAEQFQLFLALKVLMSSSTHISEPNNHRRALIATHCASNYWTMSVKSSRIGTGAQHADVAKSFGSLNYGEYYKASASSTSKSISRTQPYYQSALFITMSSSHNYSNQQNQQHRHASSTSGMQHDGQRYSSQQMPYPASSYPAQPGTYPAQTLSTTTHGYPQQPGSYPVAQSASYPGAAGAYP